MILDRLPSAVDVVQSDDTAESAVRVNATTISISDICSLPPVPVLVDDSDNSDDVLKDIWKENIPSEPVSQRWLDNSMEKRMQEGARRLVRRRTVVSAAS